MFERCLYFNLNSLTRKVNKIWGQAFEEFELSPAHAYLLRVVLAKPGISQHSIGTELNLEKSTITRFIEALVNKKFIKRHKSGREQNVYPTESAVKISQQLELKGNQLYQQMIENMGKDNLTKIIAELRQTGVKLK